MSDWRNWRRENWNEALFKHFFCAPDAEDRPVQRILMTKNELIKIVSDERANPQEIEQAFLESVRTPSHIEFNHRLSAYRIDPKSGFKRSFVPPFFIELAFSCLVASPTTGEIRTDGDFRKRLAMLLGHDSSIANYPLDRLPILWRAFSKWIDVRRSAGEDYRRLELPPLDYRVRIGYSINLAFPSRKDQIILSQVFSKYDFEGYPPLPVVFDLVGKSIDKFSNGFRKAYDEFRYAFAHKEPDLERFPFWGAVREALADTPAVMTKKSEKTGDLKLALEPSGVVLLLRTQPGDIIKGELAFTEADTPYGEFSNVLSAGLGFDDATQGLLIGRYWSKLSGKGLSAIKITVEQGVLLFKKTENLTWELAFSRQEDADFRALVKDFLLDDFILSFDKSHRPYGKPSLYAGWAEVEPFSGECFISFSCTDKRSLGSVRCLQPVVSGPRLSLINGCPVDGGFLGIPACLPFVRAPFCDTVEILTSSGKGAGQRIPLVRADETSNDFHFPNDLQNALEGSHRFQGSYNGRVLVQKDVFFHSEIVINSYARPSLQKDWEIEAGGPDTLTYGEEPPPRTTDVINTLLTKRRSKAQPKISGGAGKEQTLFNDCDLLPVIRLMEILGGLAMRRRGIPEAELLELMDKCLSVHRYGLRWDVIRAWMEAGYIERLQYKRWRRTEYFPCIPRFALQETRGVVRGTLVGLATSAFRSRTDIELIKLGVKNEQLVCNSRWLLPLPAWSASSSNAFAQVSKILGLDEPFWVTPLSETLWPLVKVAAPREPAPAYYEMMRCWDWEGAFFSREKKPSKKGVEIVLFQRPDRPSYYLVTLDGQQVWWSVSRNWSLLFGYELRGDTVFALRENDQVVRVIKGQVYLPLAVGRWLATTGATMAGPTEDDGGTYIYHFHGSTERLRILSAIWGSSEQDPDQIIRWAQWILRLSKRDATKGEPLPASIRRSLNRLPELPELRELSSAMVPPWLLPRVKQGLAKFLKVE